MRCSTVELHQQSSAREDRFFSPSNVRAIRDRVLIIAQVGRSRSPSIFYRRHPSLTCRPKTPRK
ncbi:MAG: hypothetical protein SW833_17155 [Cyanobacteriota bacterium]|nr:hypothetical protein [Cyanobacteriota bacterium]